MDSLQFWLIYLSVGLICQAIAAFTAQPSIYLLTSATICGAGALFGFLRLKKLHTKSLSETLFSAASAETFGVFWLWGGISLLMTYSFFLPPWREWGIFCIAFILLAVISFFFSYAMKADAQKGKEDAALLRIGRYLTLIQLIGMILTMVGLLIDPQKSPTNIEKLDWAANIIFFFGAFELAFVSAVALFFSNSIKKSGLV